MTHHPPNPIWTVRLRDGRTQIEVCVEAGLSLSTLRNAERGLATRQTIAKLAKVFGVPVDVLTGRKPVAVAGVLR
jgi:transcriptional regulator with XRE-family HTH domain